MREIKSLVKSVLLVGVPLGAWLIATPPKHIWMPEWAFTVYGSSMILTAVTRLLRLDAKTNSVGGILLLPYLIGIGVCSRIRAHDMSADALNLVTFLSVLAACFSLAYWSSILPTDKVARQDE